MKQSVYLTLGSNLNQERCYPLAVKKLTAMGEIAAVSPVYQTEPIGLETGAGKFFNGAVLLLTELGPEELKTRLTEEVEKALGRVHLPGETWLSRPIDVDIALWGNSVGDILGRPVPAPDILRFVHVALPLSDLAPDLPHPTDGRTLAEIAGDLLGDDPLPEIRRDIILDF
jgi:2-amino-4-hydroxy-6-hydroxymethyldihydropteridine diphosphokinase